MSKDPDLSDEAKKEAKNAFQSFDTYVKYGFEKLDLDGDGTVNIKEFEKKMNDGGLVTLFLLSRRSLFILLRCRRRL